MPAYGDQDLPIRDRPEVLIRACRSRKIALDAYVRRYLDKSEQMGYTVFTPDTFVSRRPVSHDDRLRDILEAHEWTDELLGIAQRTARALRVAGK